MRPLHKPSFFDQKSYQAHIQEALAEQMKNQYTIIPFDKIDPSKHKIGNWAVNPEVLSFEPKLNFIGNSQVHSEVPKNTLGLMVDHKQVIA
jgi:hypothetical protein